MKPIINPVSEKNINSLINDLPGSVLITGEVGVGLQTISCYIASELGVIPTIMLPEKDDKVDTANGNISVDMMRRLYGEVRVKLSGKRIFIIDYAERMTPEAQNAFLKLLEEPGEDIHFILASHSMHSLLPTVISRVHKVVLKPITIEQSNILLDLKNVTETVRRAQLLFMASGLPAEITRLIEDSAYFESRSVIIRDAREMLRGTTYNKLLLANKYKDSRTNTLLLLKDMLKIIKKSIDDNPQIENVSRISTLLDAYDKIKGNGNIRLVLARISI